MFGRPFRLWSMMRNDAHLLWFVLRHPDKPWWLASAALLLVGHVVSPADLVPNAIPVIGWVDNIVLVPLVPHMLLHGLPGRVREDVHFVVAWRMRPSGR